MLRVMNFDYFSVSSDANNWPDSYENPNLFMFQTQLVTNCAIVVINRTILISRKIQPQMQTQITLMEKKAC